MALISRTPTPPHHPPTLSPDLEINNDALYSSCEIYDSLNGGKAIEEFPGLSIFQSAAAAGMPQCVLDECNHNMHIHQDDKCSNTLWEEESYSWKALGSRTTTLHMGCM
ncbi:hypothetical protein BaRGS_00015111 [Batillaria attramentaria]|uniref:Uncharacterized protein n=1 Tax=Batillaria attramentaria TaxID=370345 RepID=A0ABD0L389_9CAEN